MSRLALRVLIALVVLTSCQAAGHSDREDAPTETCAPFKTATPRVSPRPDYLLGIAPNAGEVLTVQEYERLAPSLGWDATLPSICLSIEPYPLMEPGNFPTAEEWLSRVSVTVDGRVIDTHHALLTTDRMGIQLSDPDTGELLKRAPDGSPFRLCYAATLGLGVHNVTLNVMKQPGEAATYTWSFELTE